MNAWFLDASALVKRYAVEAGTTWVVRLTDSLAQREVLLASVTLAEVAAALAAKARATAGITVEERDLALSRFLQDCDERFVLVATSRDQIDLAVELTQRHRLRGYDAIQLASALSASAELVAEQLPPLTFVASDADLLTAAQAEGLSVDNPLDHADLDGPLSR